METLQVVARSAAVVDRRWDGRVLTFRGRLGEINKALAAIDLEICAVRDAETPYVGAVTLSWGDQEVLVTVATGPRSFDVVIDPDISPTSGGARLQDPPTAHRRRGAADKFAYVRCQPAAARRHQELVDLREEHGGVAALQ